LKNINNTEKYWAANFLLFALSAVLFFVTFSFSFNNLSIQYPLLALSILLISFSVYEAIKLQGLDSKIMNFIEPTDRKFFLFLLISLFTFYSTTKAFSTLNTIFNTDASHLGFAVAASVFSDLLMCFLALIAVLAFYCWMSIKWYNNAEVKLKRVYKFKLFFTVIKRTFNNDKFKISYLISTFFFSFFAIIHAYLYFINTYTYEDRAKDFALTFDFNSNHGCKDIRKNTKVLFLDPGETRILVPTINKDIPYERKACI